MELILEKIYSLVNSSLKLNTPVWSGNMKNHIKIVEMSDHKIVIKISAPYYNQEIFRKENKIVYTGPKNGKTGYARDVNLYGAFGSKGESKGWVNRTLYNACQAIANEYNAILEDRTKKE